MACQLGERDTRMRADRLCRPPRRAQPSVEFEHIGQIGELARLIARPAMIAAPGIEIAEVDRAALVRQAGGDDDPVVDMIMYQAGKGKGAEVIDPELQFKALRLSLIHI